MKPSTGGTLAQAPSAIELWLLALVSRLLAIPTGNAVSATAFQFQKKRRKGKPVRRVSSDRRYLLPQHLAQSSGVLQHLAQPAASLQHFWHSADLAQEVAQAASFLPHMEQQPVVRKIAVAQTAASVSMVFIVFYFGWFDFASDLRGRRQTWFLDSRNVA
jgi:hypothetical protein